MSSAIRPSFCSTSRIETPRFLISPKSRAQLDDLGARLRSARRS